MKNLGKTSNTAAQSRAAHFNPGDFAGPRQLGLCAIVLAAGLLAATAVAPAFAADSGLENTERNTRDSGNATLTPEDQKETPGDLKITAAIRQSVVKRKSLSLDAHNAKIITRGGVVTLRGPVENGAEKAKLQTIAEKTRGVKQVDNQLEPKTP